MKIENKTHCPICNYLLEEQVRTETKYVTEKYLINCPRCGKYIIPDTVLSYLFTISDDSEKVALLSHNIWKMQIENEMPFLGSDLINQLLKKQLPTLSDQIKNLILWLGENTDIGEMILYGSFGIENDVDKQKLQTVIGAKTIAGAGFVLDHLEQIGLIKISKPSYKEDRDAGFELTFEGWKYYEKIVSGLVMNKKAFMAMKFGDNDLDLIFQNYFKPAVKATGFELFRLDEEPRAGLIDDRLRVEIRTSRFLISDLTHENAGAYWEAGFAEGLGKPVIYTCEKSKFESQKTHFDTNHHLTIVWDKENLEEAANQLKATIRATLPDEAKLTDDEE